MRDPESDHAMMAKRRENMLNAAFRLFTEKSIESVTMEEIAKAAGCGRRTLIRYFDSKPGLVVAVAEGQWERFMKENIGRRPNANFEGMTAEEIFIFYLDSFLKLYRKHKDLLRFNQLFNVFIQSEKTDAKVMQPYQGLIQNLAKRFHIIYERAAKDRTLRTDIPEQEAFSTTLHIMLAVVTRYAVGLVYQPEDVFAPEKELEFQKQAILAQYRADR